jgi:hypothetical protein
LTSFFEKLTLKQILAAGLIIRLVAVFFSPGYSFHDDHFETIELVQKWREGIPFSWSGSNIHVFSLLYPGIHYLLFEFCDAIGITDPQQKMIWVRLFHGLVSMAGVYYGYLLTLRLTKQVTTAKIVAICLALSWLFPFLSVRSLREFFCIPFMLAATYYIVDAKAATRSILIAAFLFALAFCIRLQTVLIPLGIGLNWMFRKGYLKKSLVFGIAFIVFLFLTQGVFDWFHYGNPLASTLEYFRYNSVPANIRGYPQGPWYMYLGTVALIALVIPFIPLLVGYRRSASMSKDLRMLVLSSLLFFVFHSIYANKQERFILPFIPYFLILGIIGYRDFYMDNRDNPFWKKLNSFVIIWFIVFNTLALLVLSFSYTKRSRVDAMSYLRTKTDITGIIAEGIDEPPPPPLFYLGKQVEYYVLTADMIPTDLLSGIRKSGKPMPNYVIITGNKNLDARVEKLKTVFPRLHPEYIAQPGLVDNIAWKLNPQHNQNEAWYIYRTE